MLAGACGDDDGASVTDLGGSESGSGSGSGSSSASASGSGSASASASATGISDDELAQETDDELIMAAVDGYRVYVQEQIDTMIAETTVFTDAVRAGDIDAAKARYQISRRPWERIEPIAGLIEDIDGAVDAREDDFGVRRTRTSPAGTASSTTCGSSRMSARRPRSPISSTPTWRPSPRPPPSSICHLAC